MEKFSAEEAGSITDILTATVIIPTDSLANLCTKPFPLVPAPGDGKVIEFIDAIFIYTFGSELMAEGGKIYISYLGFSALSSCISPVMITEDESDKVLQLQLGNTADLMMPPNFGLYLQMTDCDFKKNGSTSWAKVHVMYRIHTL